MDEATTRKLLSRIDQPTHPKLQELQDTAIDSVEKVLTEAGVSCREDVCSDFRTHSTTTGKPMIQIMSFSYKTQGIFMNDISLNYDPTTRSQGSVLHANRSASTAILVKVG